MVKRIFFSAIVFIAVFICLIAMVCPNQAIARFIPKGTIVDSFLPKDLFSTSGADISSDGQVSITGANPNIYLNGINRTVRTIAIDFKEPISESFAAIMYYDTGNGLNESEKVYSSAFKGDTWICFALPEEKLCRAARIDINIEYSLNQVNLYEQEPDILVSNLENPWWEYVVCTIAAMIAFIAVFCLDIKFNFYSKICAGFVRSRRSIFIGIIVFASCLILSAGIELLCGLIFGVSSAGQSFNIYRYILICGIILSFSAFIFFIRAVDKKPERLFLILMLVVGIVMIFASPFGHIAWDVETHYTWALNASYVGDSYKTQADKYITTNQDLYWQKENALDNKNNIELVNNSNDYVIEQFSSANKITHIPSGIFIAIARFFNLNFYWRLTLGRVPNLLIYAFACYFGMKKLKSGKMILAVLAFLPTNILVATNYSYDYWVNALSILGIAYFVSEMQQPEKQISLKDNIIMCASIALACVPKQIYAPLLIIPFFLRKINFEKRKRYYCICVSAFVLLLFMLAVRSFASVNSVGDLRGGSAVNSLEQFKFILSNPLTYAKTLFKFMCSYLSVGSAKEYISNMAYVGYGYGYGTMLSLMLITAFTDKNRYDLNNKYSIVKAVNIVLFIGMAALIATALYISFTAVGSDTISGCQGRYLAPLLLPVLSVIGSGFINNTINRKLYNGLILGCCVMVNFVTIFITMTARLL